MAQTATINVSTIKHRCCDGAAAKHVGVYMIAGEVRLYLLCAKHEGSRIYKAYRKALLPIDVSAARLHQVVESLKRAH